MEYKKLTKEEIDAIRERVLRHEFTPEFEPMTDEERQKRLEEIPEKVKEEWGQYMQTPYDPGYFFDKIRSYPKSPSEEQGKLVGRVREYNLKKMEEEEQKQRFDKIKKMFGL